MQAGETIFLLLYGSNDRTQTLDALRYIMFQKSLRKSTAKLESLPPTSASAAQHSYRTYYQVQLWMGNKLNSENWGWTRQNGILQATRTTLEPAPEAILKLVFCSCKGSCSTSQCTCMKSGVKCSPLCKVCEGGACLNMETEEDAATIHTEDEGELVCGVDEAIVDNDENSLLY